MQYFAAGYFHANYWHTDYWGEYVEVTTDGNYWHTNYWHTNYWHGNYWSLGGAETQTISQPNAAQMSLTPYLVEVERLVNIEPATATRTLTAYQTDTANDVTVSATLATMTLTGINVTQDTGEYYEGDISFSVYASSAFDFTETVLPGLATLTFTGISPGVSGGTGDVLIQVTSTPAKTLTALPTETANPVVIRPLTPSLTLTEYDVTTGFGTLVNATLGTKTLTARQTNVEGTNADINEFAATLATKTLTSYSASVSAKTSAFHGRRRKRYTIKVDDEEFEAYSPQQAQQILDQLADIAEETRVRKQPKLEVTTARGKKPTSKPLLKKVAEVQERIDNVFASNVIPMTRSTIDEEIAQLMQLTIEKEIEEDDDAILTLLMM